VWGQAARAARAHATVARRYLFSSLTNNLGKEILLRFPYPVTLTVAQFGFIGLFTYVYGACGPCVWWWWWRVC
jgi:hypothetical protein